MRLEEAERRREEGWKGELGILDRGNVTISVNRLTGWETGG